MSYHTWTDYGYGIRIDDIDVDKISDEGVLKMLELAPKFYGVMKHDIIKNKEDEPTVEDYLEYDCDNDSGVGYLLQQVILEAEEIDLGITTNFDGEIFLLFYPAYPWNEYTEREKNLTKEELTAVFHKYTEMVCGEKIEVDYQEVSNGG